MVAHVPEGTVAAKQSAALRRLHLDALHEKTQLFKRQCFQIYFSPRRQLFG